MYQDAEDAGSAAAKMVSLGLATSLWPTPGANDQKGSAEPGQRRGQLDEAAEQKWVALADTPGSSLQVRAWVATAFSMRFESFTPETLARLGRSLKPSDGTPPDGSGRSPTRRRLNPRFVAWLMGWPPIAADGSGFSATEWSRYKQQLRSAFCGIAREANHE